MVEISICKRIFIKYGFVEYNFRIQKLKYLSTEVVGWEFNG